MDEVRFLGIDFGRRRMGLALSDPSGQIARPLETLLVSGTADAVKQVLRVIAEHEVTGIVLGMPLNMSGTTSELSDETMAFAEKLKAACAVPIYFEDERLSSRQAENVLHQHGQKIKGNKERIDRIAAAIFLQSFLDRRGIQMQARRREEDDHGTESGQ